MTFDLRTVLTPAQKEVLRLVSRGFSNDEIARELGITPNSVKDRVEGARKKLNGVRRMTAARLLVEAENAPDPMPKGADPMPEGVARNAFLPDDEWAVDGGGSLREMRSSFGVEPPSPAGWWTRPAVRLAIGMGGTLLLLVALALLKPVSEGFGWLANLVSPPFEWEHDNGTGSTTSVHGRGDQHGRGHHARK